MLAIMDFRQRFRSLDTTSTKVKAFIILPFKIFKKENRVKLNNIIIHTVFKMNWKHFTFLCTFVIPTIDFYLSIAGHLRKLDIVTSKTTDEEFEFNVDDDAEYNQKRYEALGEVYTLDYSIKKRNAVH